MYLNGRRTDQPPNEETVRRRLSSELRGFIVAIVQNDLSR